jgi:predicted nucleic acid-binding protein
MIFVDTGAWFARFVPDDPDHARVMEWFAANDDVLVTSDYCIDETLTLLVARKRPKLAIAAGHVLFSEAVARLHCMTRQQLNRSWLHFQQHLDAGWSFTDCSSKVLIDDLEVKTAAALDQHFHQFGINIVP